MAMAGTGNAALVACCGLYCGECGALKKGKCPGCLEAQKRGWCPVRKCCLEHSFHTCAECKDFPDPLDCRKFNSFMSKIFSFFFNSNRAACIGKVRELGLDGYAAHMCDCHRQSLPKRR
jgi:hypothetical protein